MEAEKRLADKAVASKTRIGLYVGKPEDLEAGKAKREAAAANVEGRGEGQVKAWGFGGMPLKGTNKLDKKGLPIKLNDSEIFKAKEKFAKDPEELAAENALK
jgi:hypothetical protein